MKKLLLSLLCLLAVGLPAFAAEQSWSVTFLTNTADSSNPMSASTAASAYISEGADNFASISATNNVYNKSVKGLKFSSGSVNGSIEWNLATAAQVKATKVVVNACRWKSSEAAKVSVNGQAAKDLTADLADYTFTLDGSKLTTLKIDATKRIYVSSVTVYYNADDNAVAAPTFSKEEGSFSDPFELTLSCATEGAKIYYTIDGSIPQAVLGDMYAGGIDIPAATTTVKAFAVKEGMTNSEVVTKTYTYVDTKCANIAEWLTKAAADKSTIFTITNSVTVLANLTSNGKNNPNFTYVKDDSGYLLVYGVKNNFVPGKCLKGLKGEHVDFNGLIEMNNSNIGNLESHSATAPPSAEVTPISAITTADMNKYVKLQKVQFDPTNKKATQGTDEIAIYYRFVGIDVPTEAGEYDIEGFVGVYNGAVQFYPTEFIAVAQEVNISWSAESVNFTWEPNYASKLPTLNNPDNVAVTYTTSDATMATIDASGVVTLLKPGNCTVTATSGSKSVSYSLTVGQVNMRAQNLISWEGTTADGYTATIGAENTFPTIKVAEGYNLIGTVYDAFEQMPSGDGATGNVATVAQQTGEVTILQPGTCRIGYIWGAGNPFIAHDNFNYLLTVKAQETPTTKLSWSASSAEITFNKAGTYTFPVLSNPDNVNVEYSTSNAEVAVFEDAPNGGKMLVVKKPGSTLVTAKDVAADAEVSYALTVNKIHFSVSFSPLTEGTFTATMGAQNTFPTMTVEPAADKDPYWFGVVYDSTNKSVATVTNDGTVTLVAPGETEIRVINGGNDYVMGDNYLGYKLKVEPAATVTLTAPEILAYKSTDFSEVTNGETVAKNDAPVTFEVDNSNGNGTTMNVYIMYGTSIDDLTDFVSVENFTGSSWLPTKQAKEPGLYVVSATVMDSNGNDAYSEFSFTIAGDVVKTYVKPLVDFLDSEGNPIDGTTAEAPVDFVIENQNPSGLGTKIYYFITTEADDPEYTASTEDVTVTLENAGEYRYKAYVATYEGEKLTGTSETVEGTFTVTAASLKDPVFAATDKDGANVESGSSVAEDKAPVAVTITNPNADTTMYISVMNITTGSSNDYQGTDSYSLTISDSGQWAISAMVMANGQEVYKEFSFTIEGEVAYQLTPAYVEFLDDDDNEVESPATKLPVNMVISNQNYYEGVEMVYTINGEEITTDEHYVSIPLTQPGKITYSVYCKLGTKSLSSVTEGEFEISAEAVKLAAPTITFTTPEGETEPVTCTISNPNLNGYGTIVYSIGTSAWFEGEGAKVTFTLPNDGVYTVRAYVRNDSDENLNSDITVEQYILDGIESVSFGKDGVSVVGGHIIAPEGSEVYTISGLRVNVLESVAPGIYIVRLSNGSTAKVVVR